jgi:hypothetical protein
LGAVAAVRAAVLAGKTDAGALTQVLGIVYRAISAYVLKKARFNASARRRNLPFTARRLRDSRTTSFEWGSAN